MQCFIEKYFIIAKELTDIQVDLYVYFQINMEMSLFFLIFS